MSTERAAGRSRLRRLARRLIRHAGLILPGHRSDWARAMTHEVEHIGDDREALRWAAGSVFASYRERGFMTRGFFVSGALVLAALLLIEGSHIVLQRLTQDRIVQFAIESLPRSLVTTDSGSLVPLSVMLVVAVSLPLAVIAGVLGGKLVRWSPARARGVIKATIVLDAAFLATIILLNTVTGPEVPFAASTALLWLIRVLFVAVPLLIALRANRERPGVDAATG